MSDSTHGVGGVRRLLLHNVGLQIRDVDFSRKVDDFDQVFGGVRIRIISGVKRGKVTGSISKDLGLTWDEFVLSVRLFLEEVSKALGRVVGMDEVLVVSKEIADDFLRAHLVDVKCLTLTDFYGNLERIYQRGDDVRREVRTSQPMSVADLQAFYQGGLTTYNIFQSLGLLTRKVDEALDVFKRIFPLLSEQVSFNRLFLDKLDDRELELQRALDIQEQFMGELKELRKITQSRGLPDLTIGEHELEGGDTHGPD